MDLDEVAHLLRVSRATARRWFRNEPGVHLLVTPGCKRPVIRVPRAAYERVLRRTANPYQQ